MTCSVLLIEQVIVSEVFALGHPDFQRFWLSPHLLIG
jgi:hypothetical protein